MDELFTHISICNHHNNKLINVNNPHRNHKNSPDSDPKNDPGSLFVCTGLRRREVSGSEP